ncbi:MAG: neutral/alkaline non-lysosomal ceramidase N-terminal domain-containing protein [Sandaracinaceae bacterium]|nr:neutral/alkaline non-lysosomal ceramidase N-terminal domain-containing protein [Sandaracinaceae bacterium]
MRLRFAALVLLLVGCDSTTETPRADAGADFGPPVPASTDHCAYEALPPTGHAGGTVTSGAVSAGTSDLILDIPVGTTMGGYTSRSLGAGSDGKVDARYNEIAGGFVSSVGVETFPHVKALALTAGEETVVIIKVDLTLAYDGITFDVERNLGADFAGKVIFATSHSHAAMSQYTANSALAVGLGQFRRLVYDRVVDTMTRAAQAALAARVPAKIGFAHEANFDPENRISGDRRSENDILPGGADRKDSDLYVIRVDRMDDTPLAVVPIFGIHGTVLDANNNLASTDAPGAIERAVEESFDDEVLVMHLQGLGGDVSPQGSGGIDCPGGNDTSCYNFARVESVGRYARDLVLASWEEAGMHMQSSVPMEMLTRSVDLGPNWETFAIREGALSYAPFDRHRNCDREIYDDSGAIISPIDEFNAPVGAALCGGNMGPIIARGQMPGTVNVQQYRSCTMVDEAAEVLGIVTQLTFEPFPLCATTRTVVSALRIGDMLVATLPGEPVTVLGDRLRAMSPNDVAHTIIIGYAQGHVGYLLSPEDWLLGGYEPSINFWGPLEGEYIVEQTARLFPLVMSDAREDASTDGTTRYTTPAGPDTSVPAADPAPTRGTVPTAIPVSTYSRAGGAITTAQPSATLPRLATARFVWIGEDPIEHTPRVTLQREMTRDAGDYVNLTRRSGRPIQDQEVLLFETPDPLSRSGTTPRTHYWVSEWQAASAWGTPGADEVGDRAGLPLGRYRFHVQGAGYMLDSNPFDVTAGAIDATVTRSGNSLALDVGYHAADGFRLLDLQASSNGHVPLRSSPVDVVATLADSSTRTFDDVETDATGHASIDAGSDAPNVTHVQITDRFGNSGGASP